MSRNQRLRPLQPIFDQEKMTGALMTGNSPAGYARAFGGTITTNTPTLVEHVFAATGAFALMASGTLDVSFVISGTGSFDGNSSSGSTAVTGTVAVIVSSGTITVSYNPLSDWTPA